MKTRNLGKTNIKISALGIGVMQFSQAVGVFKYMFPAIPRETCKEIVDVALSNGINWFDTAEYYGKGASEKSLALALDDTLPHSEEALVATKWWPVLKSATTLRKNINQRMDNLGGRTIDLYQVHQPYSISSVEMQMQEMAKLYEAGKIKSVGVSNFNADQMRRAHKELMKFDIPLASNQVEYNLLQRKIEHNGVLAVAKELGITIISWGPLSSGILTGKFHKYPEILASAAMGKKLIIGSRIQKTQPVVDVLENIAIHHGVSPTQVALNWTVTNQGDTIVAIPGASKVSHAEEAGKALDFELSEDDLKKLDSVSRI